MSCDAATPAVFAAPPGAAKRSGREVSIDWLEATIKQREPDGADVGSGVVFELLVKHFGGVCSSQLAEVFRDDAKGFDAKGPLALRVRADRVGQQDRHGNRRPWAGVRLPGEFCRAVGTAKVLAFVDDLEQAGQLKVSRVDLALDDFDKSFTPRKFAEACVAGDLDDETAQLGPCAVTRVKPDNWEWSRRKGGCFWLGSRGSARLVRVYDKDQESDGRIPATRIELQSRDEFATWLVERLLEARSAGQGIADVFLGHLVEFVDLREPNGPRSQSHTWPRLPWWHAIVGDAKGIHTKMRGDSEVWAWVEAMRRQFGGAFVVLLRAAGVDPKSYAFAPIDHDAARRVVSAVRTLVGGELRELSAEHELRLEQLTRENGWRVRELRRQLAGGRTA